MFDLGLNILEAEKGCTWKLLPPEADPATYPMPTRDAEIFRVCSVSYPHGKRDSGVRYIIRCRRAWKDRQRRKASLRKYDPDATAELKIANMHAAQKRAKDASSLAKAEIRKAVDGVKTVAAEATASLATLYDLMRKGLEKQMKAYVAGKSLNDEQVTHSEFQGACRNVHQTMSRFGLPDDQDAASEEVRKAIEDEWKARTQEAAVAANKEEPVAVVIPPSDGETEH